MSTSAMPMVMIDMLPLHNFVSTYCLTEYLYTKYPFLGAIVSCCFPNRQRRLLEKEKQQGSSSDFTGESSTKSLCCYCLCNKTVPMNYVDSSSSSNPHMGWKIRAQDYVQDNQVLSINNNNSSSSSSSSSSSWLPPSEETESGEVAPPPIKLRATKHVRNVGVIDDSEESGQRSVVGEVWSPTVSGTGSSSSGGGHSGTTASNKPCKAGASTIVNVDNDFEDDNER